jgi:hypothetical protein
VSVEELDRDAEVAAGSGNDDLAAALRAEADAVRPIDEEQVQ